MHSTISFAYGLASYTAFSLIVAYPFMSHFQLTVLAYFVVWLVAFGVLVAKAAGLIRCFRFSQVTDCYIFCGGLMIVATCIFVLVLHDPFAEEVKHIAQIGAAGSAERLNWLSEFIFLVVSLLGGGVGGNLIASAITLHRAGKQPHASQGGHPK